MKSAFCIIACVALAVLGEAKKLPSYIHMCKVTDPSYDACLMKTVESLRPRLVKGIAKLRVPPLEPFTLPALEVHRDLDALKVNLKVKDIKAFGGSNFHIDSMKTDPIKLTLSGVFTLPALATEGEYDIDGRLLLIPLRGKGIFKGNFTNVRAEVSGKGKAMTVGGVKRLVVTDIKTKIRLLGESDVKFINRPEDPQNAGITETVSTYFNQNQKLVYNIIYPILDETAQEIMMQFAESILADLEYDDLLPR